MFLSEPQRTSFDLTFSFLGFPVRVHPGFFIMPILLGGSMVRGQDMNPGIGLLVLTAVFFLSILVHELGHTLAFRFFGQPSRILLYWMGGLAIPDANSWQSNRTRSFTPEQQIMISFAGPLAGFLLAGVFAAGVLLLGGELILNRLNIIWFVEPDFSQSMLVNYPKIYPAVATFFFVGLWCNIFWNVLNLVPIIPLDGGQISRQLFMKFRGQDGVRMSLMVSVFVGGLIALYGLLQFQDTFLAILFGFLAYSSYQALQQHGRFGGRGPW